MFSFYLTYFSLVLFKLKNPTYFFNFDYGKQKKVLFAWPAAGTDEHSWRFWRSSPNIRWAGDQTAPKPILNKGETSDCLNGFHNPIIFCSQSFLVFSHRWEPYLLSWTWCSHTLSIWMNFFCIVQSTLCDITKKIQINPPGSSMGKTIPSFYSLLLKSFIITI